MFVITQIIQSGLVSISDGARFLAVSPQAMYMACEEGRIRSFGYEGSTFLSIGDLCEYAAASINIEIDGLPMDRELRLAHLACAQQRAISENKKTL